MQSQVFTWSNEATATAFMTAHGMSCRVRLGERYMVDDTGRRVQQPAVVYYHSPEFATRGAYISYKVYISQSSNRLMLYMRLMEDLHLNPAEDADDEIHDIRTQYYNRTVSNRVADDFLAPGDWRRYEVISQVGRILTAGGFPLRFTADTIWLYMCRTANIPQGSLTRAETESHLLACAPVVPRRDLPLVWREGIVRHQNIPELMAALDEGLAYDIATGLFPRI